MNDWIADGKGRISRWLGRAARSAGFGGIVLAGLTGDPGNAQIISYEAFDTPVTHRVNGYAGGTGWLNAWNGNNPIIEGSPAPNLVASVGNSLQAVGGNTASFRSLTTNGVDELLTPQRKFGRDGTTLWLSFIMQRDTRPAGNRYLGLSLFEDGSERLFIGNPFNADVWGFEVSSVGSATRTTIPITNGVPVLLVLKMAFGTSGTRDTYSFFVNPSPGLEPQKSDAETVGNLSFNRLRITGGEGAIRGLFDEIRLGRSYADVVPAPLVPSGIPYIPASMAVPVDQVNTNAPGFRVRVVQATALGGGLENSIARAEAQLAGTLIDPATGEPYLDEALFGSNAEGSHDEPSTINYNQAEGGTAGNFGLDRGIPGIPGSGGHTDNIAMEAIAYLELPAGTNRFGVNSDDGFRLTLGVGANPRDRTATTIGVFDAGRGSVDSIFDCYVERAGIYAARLVWFESLEGANVEWFSVDPASGEKVLINDRNRSGAVRAWREVSGPLLPFASRIEPLPDSIGQAPDGELLVELTDQSAVVITQGIRMDLDGVVAAAEISQAGTITRMRHRPTNLFAPGSLHSVVLTYRDSAATDTDRQIRWRFQVEDYPTLLSAMALGQDVADRTQPGFNVRVVQSKTRVGPTRLSRAEAQLAERILDPNTDQPYPNVADLTAAGADGYFVESGTLNYNQEGGQGQDGQFKPDRLVPGIPGTTGSVDHFAAEVLTYLELPAGLHRFGVNSDDGFRLTVGRDDPRDALGVQVGVFDGDRGAGDTVFSFLAPVAGIYPFRLVWWEGTGGASLEWYSLDRSSGERVLINDSGHPSAIRAWRRLSVPGKPYVARVDPLPGEPSAGGDSRVALELDGNGVDLAEELVTSSIRMQLGTADVPTQVRSERERRVIEHLPSTLFPPGSTHPVRVIYRLASETVERELVWRFTVESYAALPISAARPVGSADVQSPGFRYRVVQGPSSAELSNTSERAEAQLAWTLKDPSTGILYSNEATPGLGPDGTFLIDGVINFDQDGPKPAPEGEGNFRPDGGMPGIPGATGHADAYSTETVAWLELPEGYLRVGVNSDDGFRVTLSEGPDPSAMILGGFEGGRGPEDTLFGFVVPVAGLYPFRLIHYDGSEGSSLEWFTVEAGSVLRKVLINDRTRPTAIRAWRARKDGLVPLVGTVERTAEGVRLRWPGDPGVRLQRWTEGASARWEDVPGTDGRSEWVEPVEAGVRMRLFRWIRP